MMLNRTRLAADIYTHVMAGASNLSQGTPQSRKEVFTKAANYCFEMADAFIEASKKV